MLLGYTDAELANMGGYDLVHYDDLAYVASAHQECKSFFLYYDIVENEKCLERLGNCGTYTTTQISEQVGQN